MSWHLAIRLSLVESSSNRNLKQKLAKFRPHGSRSVVRPHVISLGCPPSFNANVMTKAIVISKD